MERHVKVWTVLWVHEHGTDAWPIIEYQSEDEIIEILREDGEWDADDDSNDLTYIEVRGPCVLSIPLEAGPCKE